jgi:uncharacterized protein YbaP (TraB family)
MGVLMVRFLLICLVLICTPAQAAGERLLFYKAESATTEVYLLGSMHLARADIYPLRPEIMQAFAASDSLAVELDISGGREQQIQQQILLRGTYPPGETIRDHLSEPTWKELQKAMVQSGLPVDFLQSMRPGLLVTTLSSLEMMKLGLSTEMGVDRFFLSQARTEKRIHELETVEQQVNLLLGFPSAELLVQQSLDQLENMEMLMDQLVSVWKRGDAPALQKLMVDDEVAKHPEFRPVYERLLDHRNHAMAEQIDGFLRGAQRSFVVVGAAHLVGDQGIVALLEKRGYKLQQL